MFFLKIFRFLLLVFIFGFSNQYNIKADDKSKKKLVSKKTNDSFLDTALFLYNSKYITYGDWNFTDNYKFYSDLNFYKKTNNTSIYILKGNVSGSNKDYFLQAESIVFKKYNQDPLIKSIYFSDQGHNKGSYEMNIEGGVKILSNERDLFYADNLNINRYLATLDIENLRGIYGSGISDSGIKILTNKIKKDINDDIEINNLRLSGCMDHENISWFNLKKNNYSNKCDIPDLKINKVGQEISPDEYFGAMPMNIKINKLIGKSGSDYYSAKGIVFQIFGKTIFKVPKMSIRKDFKFEDSGFMPVMPLLYGGNNYGLSIPFYINHNKKADTIIAPELYLHSEDLGLGSREGLTKDLQRERENNLRIVHRRLFSLRNNIPSILSIKGSITDKTGLISDDLNLYKTDGNGNIKYGYRGYYSIYADFSLTKNTDLRINYRYSSDPYFGLLYRYNYVSYAENEIKLNNITDNRNLSLSAVSFTPLILNFNKLTTPEIAPMFNFKQDFKFNRFGGYTSIFARGYSLDRQEGYSSSSTTIGAGYYTPNIINKLGQRFNVESEIEFRNNKSGFSAISSAGASDTLISDYYDNYYTMLSNNFYSFAGDKSSNSVGLMRGLISADSIFLSKYRKGNFLFRPVAALYMYKGSNNSLLGQNETSYQSNLSYFNLFSLNRVSGIDAFESGTGVRYGFEAKYKKNGYKVSLGMGVDTSFSRSYDNPLISSLYTNYSKDILTSVFSFSTPSFLRYNLHYSTDASDLANTMRYIQSANIQLTKNISFFFQNSYFNQNYSIFNYNSNYLLSSVQYNFNKRININLFTLVNLGDQTEINGVTLGPINFFGSYISYDAGCVVYRLGISKVTVISSSGGVGGYRVVFRLQFKV